MPNGTETVNIIKLEIDQKDLVKELEKLTREISENKKAVKELTDQNKKLEAEGKKGGNQHIANARKIELLKTQAKELTTTYRNNQKTLAILTSTENQQLGTLQKLELANKKLRAERARLNLDTDQGRKRLLQINSELDRNNKLILQNSDALKKQKIGIGAYPKLFGSAKAAIVSFASGIVGASVILNKFIRIVKNGITVLLGFDAAMSSVEAITKATTQEISELREQAKDLGGTTEFTATQVAMLQKELGKLGFTSKEILEGAGGILDLAAATGEDLAQSAEVAGATVRIFGLEAAETARVSDVLAASFTGSALNLEKYSTAITKVGPVARAFGFSLEETTGLLGALANAGFDASTAGTATRNILLSLADANGELAKELGGSVNSFNKLIPALIELRDGGVDLNKTLELTDKRSVAAFNRFLEAAEFTRDFADELRNAAGAAEEMADIQLDNLRGDLTILKSAFEGLTIAVGDSGEVTNDTRLLIQILTLATQRLTENTERQKTKFEEITKTIFDYLTFAINPLIKGYRLLKKVTKDSTDEIEDQADAVNGLGEQELRIIEIQRQNEAAVVALAKARREAEAERQKQAEEGLEGSQIILDFFDRTLKDAEDSLDSSLEFQQELFDQSSQNFLNTEQHKTDILDEELKKRNEAEVVAFNLTKEIEQAKLDTAQASLNAIGQLFGQQTAIGKAAAVAETAINTYRSATAAFAALAGIPFVGPALGAIAAGAAITAGLANVRKILSVKSGLPGDTGGGAPVGGIFSLLEATRPGNRSRINDGGITTRSLTDPNSIQQGIDALLKAPQKILVVDEVTAKQMSQKSVSMVTTV